MARILIVDDDESVARVLTHCLQEAGHVPTVAPTGHTALAATRTHPDVILLDLGLPDISGVEVLRRLKREPNTAQIPVVIVSGEPDAADNRLISTGSNPLVRQVSHRVGTDRARGQLPRAAEAVTWTEIIRRAKQEGLLGEAEGRALLQGVPR